MVEECISNHEISYERSKMIEDSGLKITHFNIVMFGKQIWCQIEKQYSLFSRVLKERYFKNASSIKLIRSYFPFYEWQSIISDRYLVNKLIIKNMGSVITISVSNDHWLSTTRPRLVNSNQNNFTLT